MKGCLRMKNNLLTALTLSTLLLSVNVLAETTPDIGEFDPRVRIIPYNKYDVTKLVTFFGVSTHIEFSKNEEIKDIAIGDPTAWEIIPRINNIYIRPKAETPDTNLTIVTNERSYQFTLFTAKRSEKDKTAWQDPNLIYSLSFAYNDADELEEKRLTEARLLKEKLESAEQALKDQKIIIENVDYWAAGSAQISPTTAKDDGRFIYLTFSNNRDIPAIYEVNEFGEESLINANVDGNTVIIHRMVKQLRLRKGAYVACVINRSFNLDSGRDNNTGTISNEVKRTVKGAE